MLQHDFRTGFLTRFDRRSRQNLPAMHKDGHTHTFTGIQWTRLISYENVMHKLNHTHKRNE